MLIVLSGCETIHKKFFGRRITGALNKFKIDGYTVDFTTDNFEVTDATGKLVHRASDGSVDGINDLIIDSAANGALHQDGHNALMNIVKFHNDVILMGSHTNHYGPAFINLWYDYGIFSKPADYKNNSAGFQHPHTYQDVVDSYRNRGYDNFVITGIFSRHFIDSLKKDIGDSNVKVINIVRNPSVCFLLNEKSAEFYQSPQPANFRTPLMDYTKLQWSIWNAHNLSRFDDVLTLKYEDIINTGSFDINGVKCNVTGEHTPHSKWLTGWEKATLTQQGMGSQSALAEFNDRFTHFSPQHVVPEFSTRYPDVKTRDEFINLVNNLNSTTLPTTAMDVIPVDMFSALGYTPLSYNDITL